MLFKMAWNNELCLEFLRLYKAEPVIWNPEHPLRKNRAEVAGAWTRINTSFSVECTVHELKRKKESLLSMFRPMLRKVRDSIKTASSPEDVYKPSWFAYEPMATFLQEVYQSKSAMKTEALEAEANSVQEAVQSSHEEAEDNIDLGSSDSTEGSTPVTWIRKRKRVDIKTVEKTMTSAYDILQNMSAKTTSTDVCSQYAHLLATKLRMFDERTRDYVMNDIDNLVFRAKMKLRHQPVAPIHSAEPPPYNY